MTAFELAGRVHRCLSSLGSRLREVVSYLFGLLRSTLPSVLQAILISTLTTYLVSVYFNHLTELGETRRQAQALVRDTRELYLEEISENIEWSKLRKERWQAALTRDYNQLASNLDVSVRACIAKLIREAKIGGIGLLPNENAKRATMDESISATEKAIETWYINNSDVITAFLGFEISAKFGYGTVECER